MLTSTPWRRLFERAFRCTCPLADLPSSFNSPYLINAPKDHDSTGCNHIRVHDSVSAVWTSSDFHENPRVDFADLNLSDVVGLRRECGIDLDRYLWWYLGILPNGDVTPSVVLQFGTECLCSESDSAIESEAFLVGIEWVLRRFILQAIRLQQVGFDVGGEGGGGVEGRGGRGGGGRRGGRRRFGDGHGDSRGGIGRRRGVGVAAARTGRQRAGDRHSENDPPSPHRRMVPRLHSPWSGRDRTTSGTPPTLELRSGVTDRAAGAPVQSPT